MYDPHELKAKCDLRLLVEQDLGPAAVRSGRASLWKCPFHHEHKGLSLAVWADGWRCFGKCSTSGDALDWLQHYRNLNFADAIQVLGEPLPTAAQTTTRRTASSEPPSWAWQDAARVVIEQAENCLWSSAGEQALEYLLKRGLTTTTIREARLGFIPGDYRGWRKIAGLDVPCGITIPWLACGAVWCVKVRRSYGFPKYRQIAGGSVGGLYGADDLQGATTALFCEGEFDTLLARQEAGKLVAAVTLGSASSPLPSRWYADLTVCSNILVAYDQDEAGRKGAKELLKLSPRFKAIQLPYGKDISEFFLQGGDLYAWLDSSLSKHESE